MKYTYPIILTPDNGGFTVYVPDFNVNTQGCDLTNAIEMARDAIELLGIELKNNNQQIPCPCNVDSLEICGNEIVAAVDVEFSDYKNN